MQIITLLEIFEFVAGGQGPRVHTAGLAHQKQSQPIYFYQSYVLQNVFFYQFCFYVAKHPAGFIPLHIRQLKMHVKT